MPGPISTSLFSSTIGSLAIGGLSAGAGQIIAHTVHADCPAPSADSYCGTSEESNAATLSAVDGCKWPPKLFLQDASGEWMTPSARAWWTPLWQRALEEGFEPQLMAGMLQSVQDDEKQLAHEFLSELLTIDEDKGARVREFFQGPKIDWQFVHDSNIRDQLIRLQAPLAEGDLAATNHILAELHEAVWGIEHPETFAASYALLMESVECVSGFQREGIEGSSAFAVTEPEIAVEPPGRPRTFLSLRARIFRELEYLEHHALRTGDAAEGTKVWTYLSFVARMMGRDDKVRIYARRRQALVNSSTALPTTPSEMMREDQMITRLDGGTFDFIMRRDLAEPQQMKLTTLLRGLREGAYHEALTGSHALPLEERALVLAALADELSSVKKAANPKARLISWISDLAKTLRGFYHRNDV